MSTKHKAPRRVETIAVNSNKTAMSATYKKGHEARHWEKIYDIVSDKTHGDERTIVLAVKNRKTIEKKKNELVDAIMKKLDETSKNFRKILLDTFEDYWDESIEKLYDKIVKYAPIPK